jgi:hypothetical protein
LPLDLDLQELRRRVGADPADASSWLALALGLERCGSRSEAVETLYRARALGAFEKVCLEFLEALGARPSPWTHVTGDSERTFSAPVRGPRRGEVVARADPLAEIPEVVVDVDGSVLAAVAGEVSQLDLGLRARWTRRLASLSRTHPTVGRDGTFFASGIGTIGMVLFLARDKSERGRELTGAPWEGVGLAGGNGVVAYHDPRRGMVLLQLGLAFTLERDCLVEGDLFWLWALDAERIVCAVDDTVVAFRTDTFEQTRERRVPTGTRADGLLLAPGGVTATSHLVRSSATHLTRWVEMLDARGDYVWSRNLERQSAPVGFARSPDGTVHVVSGGGYFRFDGTGRPTKVPLERTVAGGGVVVDREGVAYLVTRDASSLEGLVAVAPDGATLWKIAEQLKPVAIDSLGRLLAVRGTADAKVELVAIE